MLEQLLYQIAPEYAFLQPPPCQEHLHEAMRRILLDAIVNLKSDVPLNPKNPRLRKDVKVGNRATWTRGSKRSRLTDDSLPSKRSCHEDPMGYRSV